MRRAIATTVVAGLAVFLWMPAEAGAASDISDAAACLTHPTLTCAADLALAVSTGSHNNYERAQLVVRTGERLKDLAARKAYLDRVAARFFAGASTGRDLLDRERRVTDIAAAIMAGDDTRAARRLGEVEDHFQRWWETLADVMHVLANAGRPDLADATETRFHRVVNVNITDALGRKLGSGVRDTRAPLARALVSCSCGRDPLPMIPTLHRQQVRLDLAPILYARRHDVEGLTSFLTREFGSLAKVKDKRQRQWVGYSFGLMLLELPLRDIPAALRKRPAWLTADNFERPGSGMQINSNIYGDVLARAVKTGDRAAVAALVKLRRRGDIVWLSDMKIESPGSARADDLLPKPERDHVRVLRAKFTLAHGDAHKGLAEAMHTSIARIWRNPHTNVEEGHDFEENVLEPLLTRGAFDVAEEAVSRLRDPDLREALRGMIATARTNAANSAPKDAASKLAALWKTYQQAKTDPKADPRPGQTFLFAVRDLIAAQPDAFPLNERSVPFVPTKVGTQKQSPGFPLSGE
ncbi:MAG TPA: hypothetical protein VFT69_01050 [Pseudolabrys sp.]|nr:hypothetical protein [Pseudolabrys sp.]